MSEEVKVKSPFALKNSFKVKLKCWYCYLEYKYQEDDINYCWKGPFTPCKECKATLYINTKIPPISRDRIYKRKHSYKVICKKCGIFRSVERTDPHPSWYASTGRTYICGKCNNNNYITLTREKVPQIIKRIIEEDDLKDNLF